jgi:hypothetical protein
MLVFMPFKLPEQESGDNLHTVSDTPEKEITYSPYAHWDSLQRCDKTLSYVVE